MATDSTLYGLQCNSGTCTFQLYYVDCADRAVGKYTSLCDKHATNRKVDVKVIVPIGFLTEEYPKDKEIRKGWQ